MNERPYFNFLRSFLDAIEECPLENQLELYRAIVHYALNREEPGELSPTGKVAWILIRPIIDKQWVSYENGKKGGAPEGNSNAVRNNRKTTEKQPKNNPNSTEKQPDKDKEKEIKEIPSKEGTKKVALSLPENPRFLKFNEVLKAECPHVAKMEKQMSCKEFEKALEMFGGDSLAMWEMLRKMENRKGTEKNNRSVYLTLCNWRRREAGA